MFINIVGWRVLKKNSEKQFELWREMMDYQKSHPEKVYYIRSRFFTFTEKGSSEENWMFLRNERQTWKPRIAHLKVIGENLRYRCEYLSRALKEYNTRSPLS